ncbi:SSI family serine proteinase inhibitor [Streptomyces sp. NPDC058657]|uniref:SSI family serine proteinase inhibitor n=1 Tax=unclassified Streptomyces TaxID=2593676 RepID=UPI00364C69B4
MATVRTAVRRTLVGTMAAAALLAGAGGAAAQEPRPQEPTPQAQRQAGNWMRLAVVEGEDTVGISKGALLRCPQPKPSQGPKQHVGGHLAPRTACGRLDRVDGDLARIKRADIACPLTYRPVTALAYGKWDGRRVAFAKTYPNACVMHASTGGVFKLR